MGITRFEIVFDNPQATYFSGQDVTGSVVIELLKEKKMRAVELHFHGAGNVQWQEKRGESTIYYSAKEIYIQNTVNLIGGPSSEIILPPGNHSYPFRLILPTTLPSSFEGEFGCVRHTVIAAICRPWRFDHKCKAAFTILNSLDLNNEPALQEPVQITSEKRLWFGRSGKPITVTVSLPFAGYVPGQKCSGSFELENPTSNNIKTKACIRQVITYIANGGHKKMVRNSVAKEKFGTLKSNDSMKSSFNLQIPVLPNSFLNGCNCINIDYTLEIVGKISGMHRDLQGIVPIVIGSIPFITQFALIAPWKDLPSDQKENHLDGLQEMDEEAQGASSAVSCGPYPFLSYPDLPPPSYEESTSGRANIRNDDDDKYVRGELEFAPRYPVYLFKE